MDADLFKPYQALAGALLPHALGADDASHDTAHLQRVWKNAAAIQAAEGGDPVILIGAVLLHDCVGVEKDSPHRAFASRLAARKASEVLDGLGWDSRAVAAIAHAIEAHSFSAGITPQTLEAKIVQDADRLDAIGMIGVARCFYTAGRLGRALYDRADPEASSRPYDDTRYAIDHFHTKLLTLASGFHTATGVQLARRKQERLRRFLDEFIDEI